MAPLLVLGAGPANAQPAFTATPIPTAERIVAAKAPTSRLARSDQAILDRTDTAPVSIMVKLDYDSAATYTGGVGDLEATSPSVTGEPLDGDLAEQRYDQFAAGQEAEFAAALAQVVPGAKIDKSLRTVYGGVAVTVPADRAEAVLAIDNVVAVQANELRKPLTDSSPEFLGAPTIYNALGTVANAGQGTILGNLDSGVWPEHPSLADQGNLPAPPGPARECNYGNNPITPADDPFVCQHKLIGGAHFTDFYDANVGDDPDEGTARDSEGHGTHTATTSAGNIVDDVSILGNPLPAIQGLAPGAWVMEYKVCGPQGCYNSDSTAAVGQAILDGVDVINFSISGGSDPSTDPVELAFLDAYGAGVFVSASAGNSGPGAATSDHLSPWVTTVAASTQTRQFATTITLTGSNGDVFTTEASSLTPGVGPLPVVLSSAAPYGRALCDAPAPAGLFTGKIVACQRGGNGRVEKGFNVVQGGAAGMILYNPTLQDTETDTHWLPAAHIADGRQFLAFVNAHSGVIGSFPTGTAKPGVGDVMAAFSSRGPGGLSIKPDLTAPGVQILAGDTPVVLNSSSGPPNEYFQAIAGTSMSSPHVAGAALLVRALHPDWTPGQIRSALMTTAKTSVVKEDLTTPADPFDFGSGRIDLSVAGSAGLTLDESVENMALLGTDPINAVNLNIPSIDAPVLPGRVVTTRTVENVTGERGRYDIETTAPAGSSITVVPDKISLAPGASATLTITISSQGQTGQQFGEVRLVPRRTDGNPALHLPVAFVPQQGEVTLTSGCTPDSVFIGTTSTCTVAAQNTSNTDTTAELRSTVSRELTVRGATGATLGPDGAVTLSAPLKGGVPGVPAVDPGTSPAGYLPLDTFGITPTAIGDEEFVNLNVAPFVYAGVTYTSVGVNSNGYVVAGGGTAEDDNCCNLPSGPSPARPNGMLAPFWTDLDGTGATGILAGRLTDGVNAWTVIEYRVNVFGTTDQRVFQIWIGANGTEDISYAYPPDALPTAPAGQDFLVGAENTVGQGDMVAELPTQDQRVTSSDPSPGDSVSYTFSVEGVRRGTGVVTTTLNSPIVPGTTVVTSNVAVTRR